MRRPCVVETGRDHFQTLLFAPMEVIFAKSAPATYSYCMVPHVTPAIRRNPRVHSAKGKEKDMPPALEFYLLCVCNPSKRVYQLDCNPDADSRQALVARLSSQGSGRRATNGSPTVSHRRTSYVLLHTTDNTLPPCPARSYCVIGRSPGCAAGSPFPPSMSSEDCGFWCG